MSDAAAPRKSMTFGEGGLALAFAALAFLSIVVAAKAYTPEYAFHAYLFAAASVAAVFAIINRYYERPAALPPLTVDGKPNYNMGPVKFATVAGVFWGIAGFTVGLYLACELAFPFLNLDLPWISFGRLRPLHTSAVIFAFGGNVLIATSFYVVQRTCRARLAGDLAPWFVVLGYNFFIVIAGTGYLLGITQSKEYAEPEWYADLWLTIVWVVYFLVFLGTIMRRNEPHIYVANWFYLAFIVTIAVLHLGNNAAMPVSLFSSKSYIVWSGVQDAMVQWWYGHNAVGFFLTAGFLAIMYYFIPKRADRPVYSYRLSIIHFWALIFLYIWAGPHHLHYTALPDWAQTLGMTFSIMLWMPSWGGMINGIMTLSGAWDKLRTDPVLRMMVVSVAFYGMSTFEGPMMSVKIVNSLSHYTDWTIGHVHSGALGWVAYISFGARLLPGAVAVEQAALLAQAGQLALLDLDHRHRALHHLDVGVGHPAGPDVARLHLARLPRIFLRRDRRGDASLLHHPRARRRAVPDRRADHGLQSLENRERRKNPRQPAGVALVAGGIGGDRQCRSGQNTPSSRRTRSFSSSAFWS